MARCRETLIVPVLPGEVTQIIELACDLDEHENILGFHYDKLRQIEWRHPLEPMGVPATRTTPPRTMKAKASKTSLMDQMLELRHRSIL